MSMEEKKKFLASKMNEEEIEEAIKRFNKGESPKAASTAVARIATTNSHFANQRRSEGTNWATVASVAILSSVGITYLLDNYKDRQDKNLRDELKDRVKQSLEDQKKVIQDIERTQRQLQSQLLTREDAQQMIDSAVAKLQAQLNLDEVNKKSMTLKIRSNRNNYMRE